MLPETVSATAVESPASILAAYGKHLLDSGRGNSAYESGARSFVRSWPRPQAWAALPLDRRLAAGSSVRPFVTFLMVSGRLQPGYDYLVGRKLCSLWHELSGSSLEPDLHRFMVAALELGFTSKQASAVGSQIIARLLIETGGGLEEITENDFSDLIVACKERQQSTGRGWRHYRSAIHAAHQVLFHLGIFNSPAPPAVVPKKFEDRMNGINPVLAEAFVAYLHRKSATCRPKTVSSLATKMAHFGRFLSRVDPGLSSLASLDRRGHIEPFLTSLRSTLNTVTGEPITVADHARRVNAVANFLTEISEWGWDEAPSRRLLFASDVPRLPRPLPRYLPVDADRRLTDALTVSAYRLAAGALLLQRACGLRIGELLDLELDCVHEVPGQGAWLKVPLGKLETERMVPLDEQILTIIDEIIQTRSAGRPLPHPRTGRPAQFLFTHYGKRLSQNAVRAELNRAAGAAGIGHVTPHQLRHTYATALVNAGVSLQSLMALLGHTSAEMSLRYGKLFDTTVRTEYERALGLAKSHIGALPPRTQLPLTDVTANTDWKDTPTVKARLAGGFCMRAPAQGACPYANICEHCPSFRTDATYLPVLASQRTDAATLAADAQARGWIDEADRHLRLLDRLDALITQTQDAG